MSDFRKRMKDSSSQSSIILANDLDDVNLALLEKKTLKNIKLLGKYLCAIKFNFHLLLPLGEKNIKKINQVAHDFGLQTIADIKLNDIGNTNIITLQRLWQSGFDAVIANLKGSDRIQYCNFRLTSTYQVRRRSSTLVV